jgi:hypothetical protein
MGNHSKSLATLNQVYSENEDHLAWFCSFVIQCSNKDQASHWMTDIYILYKQLMVNLHNNPDKGDGSTLQNVGF